LPASYEKDDFYIQKKYPVLILLDGDTHFHSAGGIIRYMGGNEQIPEMIVVAVSNTNRTRDFTPTKSNSSVGFNNSTQAFALSGGADNFLRFLDTELLPQINKDYRTLPYRVLVGHSLGGLFAVDSFLNQRVFNAYLAIDPTLTWDDQIIIKKARSILAGNKSLKLTLYLAQANNPFNEGKSTGERGEAFQAFNTSLAAHKSEELRYKYAFFEKEDHFSVPLQSLYHGLLFIFEGYKFPLNTLANRNAAVRKHYEIFTRRLGVDMPPPGKLLNGAGLFLLGSRKKADKAIELFKFIQESYPQSFVPYNSLGDAYKVKGNKEMAIINYRKSLEINPNNENAKRSIKELTSD
jgi:predicted alpha/beta superfamily hydrolase